jgi:hypothetical protein
LAWLFGVCQRALSAVYVSCTFLDHCIDFVDNYLSFKGLAIKVQEKKRDDALNRLVPAAATVISNWWRLQCAYRDDRFVSTWKIYTLIQRRVHACALLNRSTDSAPAILGSQTFPFRSSSTHTTKTHHIRRKSIMSVDDLPKRYVTAIKMIRILKYSIARKKFQQAKRPIDIKDVLKENTQMNNRLSIMLNDVQRRLDCALGTSRTASYLSDEQKRQLTLSARIEKLETLSNRFESKLTYLEELASTLLENA